MEQAILGLVGLMIMLALNQERVRRADMASLREDVTALRNAMTGEMAELRKDTADKFAALRREMTDGFAAIRREMTDGFAAIRKEMTDGFAAIRGEMQRQIEASAARTDARIDNLTNAVIDLSKAVGAAEGRADTLKLVD